MCLLISGPDRLPGGVQNIILSIFCYCLVGFALIDEQRSYATILSQIALELLLLALVCYSGLKWKGQLPRFPQAFSALIGVNIIISIVSIPAYRMLVQDDLVDGDLNRIAINTTMVIVFWSLVVMTSIFKKAFNVNTLMAAMISFNYFLVYQFIVVWFF
ncbi:MAG: hypothetical protein ACERLB_08815 [Gammaproteobacteria bacterium]